MFFEIDLHDAQRQADEFLYSSPFPPVDGAHAILDDKKHRFRIAGDKSHEKSGEYCFHSDGWPAGYVASWRHGEHFNWKYELDDKRKLDPEYEARKQELIKSSLETIKHREAEIEKEQQLKSQEAQKIFNEAHEDKKPYEIDTPYLKNKRITADFLRVDGQGNLLVPIRDIDGHFMTIQYIDAEGHKRFYAGAPVQGGFFYANNERNEKNSNNLFSYDVLENPAIALLICEGMATAKSLLEITDKKYPVIAAMNCNNILTVAKKFRERYPQRKIYIMADNDKHTQEKHGKNPGLDAARQAVDEKIADAFIYPKFPELPPMDGDQSLAEYLKMIGAESEAQEMLWRNGTDWNDYLLAYGLEKTKNTLSNDFLLLNTTKEEQEVIRKVHAINAQDLLNKEIPPIKWAIDGMLPEGLTILAGSPKTGKSILSFNFALAISIGGVVLGKISVKRGQVLYLALEDTERRLKDRIQNSGISTSLDLLTIVTSIPRQDEGGLAYIEWWLRTHTDARLVIIDTWEIFRKIAKGTVSIYSEDYSAMHEVKKLADQYNVSILVVHHMKKGNLSNDVIQGFSGSTGITASADCLLAIIRERTKNTAVLFRTGRDVEEKNFGLVLDHCFCWVLVGDAETVTMPQWKKDIIEYLREHGECSPMDLAKAVNISVNTAKTRLRRLADEKQVFKSGYGVYRLKRQEEN